MRKYIYGITSILVVVAVVVSCNYSGMGIYYSIKEEQPLADNALPNDITVQGMIKSGGSYYVAAGKLYVSPVAAVQADRIWETIVPPEPNQVSSNRSLCVKVISFSSLIIALYISLDGSKSSLYALDTSKDATTANAWTIITDLENKYVDGVVSTQNNIFVSTRVLQDGIHVYTSYESSDGTTYATISLSEQYTSIIDAAEYNTFSWIISGTNLYSDSGGSFALQSGTGVPASASGFRGIYASSAAAGDILFLSSVEGQVFVLDGVTWTAGTEILDANDNTVSLTDISEVTIDGIPIILLGTENGYYDIVLDGGYNSVDDIVPVIPGSAAESSTDQNYLKITLKQASINFFFVDTVTTTIFAATSVNGLWANYIHTGDDSTLIKKWDPE